MLHVHMDIVETCGEEIMLVFLCETFSLHYGSSEGSFTYTYSYSMPVKDFIYPISSAHASTSCCVTTCMNK